MKYAFILIVGVLLVSCGARVPYTNEIRDEFGLDSEASLKKVQFFTSATIILEKSQESGNQGTNEAGALVTNKSREKDQVVIQMGTKCVFDGYSEDGGLKVRFETGVGKTLTFNVREGQTSGKYYFVADWKSNPKGEVEYGNETYYAVGPSGTAYLQVVLKKLQKTKKKVRVVKGMKV